MTTRYWTASLDVAAAGNAYAGLLVALNAEKIDAELLLIDVIHQTAADGTEVVAVLLGRTSATQLNRAYGLAAFTDSAAQCELLASFGLLAVTTRIVFEDSRLVVHDPLAPAHGELLVLEGVVFDEHGHDDNPFNFTYQQHLFTPALGSSNIDLFILPAAYATNRHLRSPRSQLKGAAPAKRATVRAPGSSLISLAPLGSLPLTIKAVRSGPMKPLAPPSPPPPPPPPTAPGAAAVAGVLAAAAVPKPVPLLLRRPAEYTTTGYRFDDVELFGFRIDLDAQAEGVDAALAWLVKPLNFHLEDDAGTRVGGRHNRQDFIYRAATRTLIVELLRYGRMYWGATAGPAYPEPYTSQHELLVRLLVGRVDDDASQGRDPALYVPAIFVDNAWSQLVGRGFQGYDKRLVSMGSDAGWLRMDGTLDGGGDRVVSLSEVTRVAARRFASKPPTAADDLLTIGYAQPPDPTNGWRASAIDADGVVGSALLRSPWRQSDFREAEFRRSFARRMVDDGFVRFGSIQVAPFAKSGLPSAWLTGQMTLKHTRALYPPGVVRLKFGTPPAAPPAWEAIARLVGGEVVLAGGDWYRAAGSIDMRVDDGLI